MTESNDHPLSKVTFLGLGTMGGPMAGHLARAGLAVRVWNRTPHKVTDWLRRYPGSESDSVAEAVAEADVVCACLGDDRSLKAVLEGPNGAFAHMKPGAIFIDHTTASAQIAQELSWRARRAGLHFLDAPVTGGQRGAELGTLTIMVGGDPEIFVRATPIMEYYSRQIVRIGEAGSGQLAKMVNQICVAGVIAGLAEGLAFGQRAGLDMSAVLTAIGQGAATSWQMEHRAASMLDDRFDFGFAVDWMRKDLQLAIDHGRRSGSPLPVSALLEQFYGLLQRRGGGRLDSSSLIRLWSRPEDSGPP